VKQQNTLFPFTQKKFKLLKKETQHTWVIKWLTAIYQNLITNRINTKSIHLFASNYDMILKWLELPCKEKPESNENRVWIEFVSDAIHFHRTKTNIFPKDHDLLDNSAIDVTSSDKSRTAIETLDYHIAIDCFRSVFNVGSIFRTCDAAGFRSVILGNTPGAEHSLVQKTSMGTFSFVHSEKTDDLIATLINKKTVGYTIIGIETIKNSKAYTNFSWPQRAVLVLGNEEYGISRHVLRVCDKFVHIPMHGRKNSINVANAASVIMFHVAGKLTQE